MRIQLNRTIFVLAAAICLPGFAAKRSGDLECRLTSLKDAEKPFLTAHFSSFTKLGNIEFHYKKMLDRSGVTLKDSEDPITGRLITSNHSPYKGNIEFLVEHGQFILPADLSNENLEATLKTGIGMGRGENAVIITSTAFGDGAGSHISYRLICESDL